MKRLSVFLLFALTLSVWCGKLEDFTESFDFIAENCEEVERLPANAKYRKDFEMRLFKTKNDAADIQKAAADMGIPFVTLHDSFSGYCRYISNSPDKVRRENEDSRAFYKKDIDNQIVMLQDLEFSFENRTFTPNEKYTDPKEACVYFGKLFSECKKYAKAKRMPSDAEIKEASKRWFTPMKRLAMDIEQRLKLTKTQMPSRFKLSEHVERFCSLHSSILNSFQNERKKDMKKSDSGRYSSAIRETADIKTVRAELELLVQEIDLDREDLLQCGLEMPLVPSDQQRTTFKLAPAGKKKKDPAVTAKAEKKKKNKGEIEESIPEKKERLYSSESRMNGVSEKLYQEYRELLTPAQAKELESVYRHFLEDEGYPAAFARSEALTRIHQKYGKQP